MSFNPPISVLDVDEQTGEASTLHAFRAGKPLVLDFWNTRCTRCPAALTKLDMVAPQHPEVTFAACALSLGSTTEGTQEQVLELLEDQWENLSHLYMGFDDKEAAKKEFGFKELPFSVVYSAEGEVLFQGHPQDIDFKTVFAAKAPAAVVAAPPPTVAAVAPTYTANYDMNYKAQPAAQAKSIDSPATEYKSQAAKQGTDGASPNAVTESLTDVARPMAALGFGNDDEDF